MQRARLTVAWPVVMSIALTACGAVPGSEPAGSATPAPTTQARSPSPSPSPEAAWLPAALQYTWVGETRSIPELTPPAVESFMTLDRSRIQFFATEDWTSPIVTSSASLVGTDRVRLRLEADSVGCRTGDEGIYSFDLSSSGRALTVRAADDACASRVAAISGVWTRIACPDSHNCLGDLDAGQHVSTIYTPFARFADWQYEYGRFAYSVPEGWSNPEDNQDGYVLIRRDAPDGAGIFVFSDVLPHAQGIDPATKHCRIERAPGIGSSASAIHDWIRSLPGLRIANDREDVSVGTLKGYSLDVSVDPGWDHTCGWPDEKPGVPMFVNAQTTLDEGFDWGIIGDGRMRLFILSLGRDRTLVIDIEAQDKATWDALLEEATPIVHSFEFRH